SRSMASRTGSAGAAGGGGGGGREGGASSLGRGPGGGGPAGEESGFWAPRGGGKETLRGGGGARGGGGGFGGAGGRGGRGGAPAGRSPHRVRKIVAARFRNWVARIEGIPPCPGRASQYPQLAFGGNAGMRRAGRGKMRWPSRGRQSPVPPPTGGCRPRL